MAEQVCERESSYQVAELAASLASYSPPLKMLSLGSGGGKAAKPSFVSYVTPEVRWKGRPAAFTQPTVSYRRLISRSGQGRVGLLSSEKRDRKLRSNFLPFHLLSTLHNQVCVRALRVNSSRTRAARGSVRHANQRTCNALFRAFPLLWK